MSLIMKVFSKCPNHLNQIVAQQLRFKALLASAAGAASFLFMAPAGAEGTAQWGVTQPLIEYGAVAFNSAQTRVSSASRSLYVDITSPGEVINLSVCGMTNADSVGVQIYQTIPNIIDPAFTPTTSGTAVLNQTLAAGNVSCADPMTGIMPNPLKFTAPTTGTYEIRLTSGSGTLLRRVDVTVTPDLATPANPTLRQGRLHAYVYAFNTGSFAQSASTNADFYIKVPGGRPGENYVWLLDLNQFAGNVFDIIGNSYGVDAPRSGFSVVQSGNSVTPEYPIYLSHPLQVGMRPVSPPGLTNAKFLDSQGVDNSISPGGTIGVQDFGTFSFNTDIIGNYSIQIDANNDNLFSPIDAQGNPSGDIFINGVTNGPGVVSVPWNGRNNAGVILPNGTYNVRVQMRAGEYHFVAGDAETSGGASPGLTIFESLSQGASSDTLVFWDDATFLGGTTTLPNGAVSSTTQARHTWGDFTAGGFGNLTFIDTYTYGGISSTSTPVIITNSDTPAATTSPNVLLVKRLTAINSTKLTLDGSSLATYIDEPLNPYDDNTITIPTQLTPTDPPKDTDKWPDPTTTLIGGINGGNVKPGDEIEYTIYFLSGGDAEAKKVLLCDRVPSSVSFIPSGFNGFATQALGGLAGDRGILALIDGTTAAFTNMADGDAARYLPPGIDPTTVYPNIKCGGANTNGAIIFNLGNLPNATVPGAPTGAFGFVRFKGSVK
jgi:uncharacterized repeat protein (TIGR01451 family)